MEVIPAGDGVEDAYSSGCGTRGETTGGGGRGSEGQAKGWAKRCQHDRNRVVAI
jgi:hypothetical protein